MTVVYLDSVFLLNGLMDYLLLLAAARLAGLGLKRRRYLLAAMFGGAYAAAVFLPQTGFLSQMPVKLAAGILMVLIAFGGEEKLLRLTLLVFLLSCALAGGVLVFGMLAGGGIPVVSGIFYTDVSLGVLLAAATAAYLVLLVAFRFSAAHGIRGEFLRVKVCVGTGKTEFSALLDSGNSLRDVQTGLPMLIVSWNAVRHLFPGVPAPKPWLLERFSAMSPSLKPGLVPYRSVGVSNGLLVTVRTNWTEINGRRYEGLRIAFAEGGLEEGCSALWGGKE